MSSRPAWSTEISSRPARATLRDHLKTSYFFLEAKPNLKIHLCHNILFQSYLHGYWGPKLLPVFSTSQRPLSHLEVHGPCGFRARGNHYRMLSTVEQTMTFLVWFFKYKHGEVVSDFCTKAARRCTVRFFAVLRILGDPETPPVLHCWGLSDN